jgi:dienelactone hydrolase
MLVLAGMWSSTVNGRMISNFEEWATIFPARNIVAIFADSYTPRGFPDFRNRRPAENASIDDSLVSPAYVRPRDAFRVLNYLRGLSYVRSDAIGVMGFSHVRSFFAAA